MGKEGYMRKFVSVVLVLSLALGGCASTTTFKSNPIGADVYVDNMRIGKTPCEYSDAAIMGTSKPVKLSLEGFKPVDTVIRKEKAQIWPIIGTFLFVVPVFWMLGYQDEYRFDLEKVEKPVSQSTGDRK